MKKRLLTLLFLFITTLSFSGSNDFDLIKERIIKGLYISDHSEEIQRALSINFLNSNVSDKIAEATRNERSDTIVSSLIENIKADGSWGDIDYKDTKRSGWSPTQQLQRINILSGAYKNPKSPFYRDIKLKATIVSALEFWFDAKLVCDNWWYNQIGLPKILGPALIAMEDELSEEQLSNGIAYMKNAKIGMTGQNRVWLAYNVFMTALLERDYKDAKLAVQTIKSEITVGNAEGIKSDWSFHQHGAMVQFGNYGLAYITSMAQFARQFSDTEFQFTASQIEILRNFIVNGMSRVVWAQHFDVSSCGRQLLKSSQQLKAIDYGKALLNMKIADADNSKIYTQLYNKNILLKGNDPLKGFHYFPFSDFSLMRDNDWFATLKMSSNRTLAGEIVNNENLRGYNLSDGALMLYTDGDEYVDIFPVWKWRLIPGTTTIYENDGQNESKHGIYIRFKSQNEVAISESFDDAKIGVSAMNIDKDGLKANKSWFFCDDYIVCVGSDISHADKEVTTSINQTLSKGDVEKGENTNYTTYTHGGVRYNTAKDSDIVFTNDIQSGDWNDIAYLYSKSDTLTKKVFNIFIKHGLAPKNRQYLYIIEPKPSRNSAEKVSQIELIRSSDNIHIIKHPNNLYQIVFFSKGEVEINGKKIASECAAIKFYSCS